MISVFQERPDRIALHGTRLPIGGSDRRRRRFVQIRLPHADFAKRSWRPVRSGTIEAGLGGMITTYRPAHPPNGRWHTGLVVGDGMRQDHRVDVSAWEGKEPPSTWHSL